MLGGGTVRAISTTILSGGNQYVGDGGYGIGTVTDTTIDSGGTQYVGASPGVTATATSTTISGGGPQYVGDVQHANGSATGTTIDGDGWQYVGAEFGTGTATSPTIRAAALRAALRSSAGTTASGQRPAQRS